jgi:D-alanyl-D-alanine dipeptidase
MLASEDTIPKQANVNIAQVPEHPNLIINMMYSQGKEEGSGNQFAIAPQFKEYNLENFYHRDLKDLYLHKKVIPMFQAALDKAASLGYKIKVRDGFRPLDVQVELFTALPVPGFVSDPKKGLAGHTRGIAIDLTLVDAKTDQEIDMGTCVDFFGEKAYTDCKDLTPEQIENRRVLKDIIESTGGLRSIPTEWWHFNLPADTINDEEYPKLSYADLPQEIVVKFLKK